MTAPRTGLLAALLLAPCTRMMAQRALPFGAGDTVFVVPGSHLDIGFTAPISMVERQRIAVLDQAIDVAERDPGFVWFEEGGWVVERWLDRYRDNPRQVARLRALVRQGRIGIGATLLSAYNAAFPGGLRLLTAHLDRVDSALGVRPRVAVLNDVPSAPEALVDALAAAGIRYLLMGPNLTFSPPLPERLLRRPFWWESSRGARVLVFMDDHSYGAAMGGWGLPPECGRLFNPRRFPGNVGNDSDLTLGAAAEIARLPAGIPLTLVQAAYDNWDTQCAQRLPAAVALWNQRRNAPRILLATPDVFFTHLEHRLGAAIPVRRGAWGGDWDLLAASQPVWSWRLRQALAAVTSNTSHDTRITLAEAIDHNVGLGPRWQGNLPPDVAMQHVDEVAALYARAVQGTLGARGTSLLPAPLAVTASPAGDRAWRGVVGAISSAARVRSGGPGFLGVLLPADAPVSQVPITIRASPSQLLVHTRLDHDALERLHGARFSTVIEVRLDLPYDSLRIAPANVPSAIAGHWLLGSPPRLIVSPDGVRVRGPGLDLFAHGPLILGWNLQRDPRDPRVTWLQALAFIHAVEGDTPAGKLRRPFSVMYPGEPTIVDFDLLLERGGAH